MYRMLAVLTCLALASATGCNKEQEERTARLMDATFA